MHRLVLSFISAAAVAAPVTQALASEPAAGAFSGQKVYVTKCGKCHKFYDPARYSDAKWDGWMAKMSKKAKLTPEQEKELSKYVQEALRSGKSQRAEAARH